jgi:hypothetical protein
VGVRKGGVWRSSGGREIIARSGSWRLQAQRRQPGDLDAQIDELLASLTDDIFIWQDLARRYQADIFCGLFLSQGNQGLGLHPETLAAVGQRSLQLGLDIYDAETMG